MSPALEDTSHTRRVASREQVTNLDRKTAVTQYGVSSSRRLQKTRTTNELGQRPEAKVKSDIPSTHRVWLAKAHPVTLCPCPRKRTSSAFGCLRSHTLRHINHICSLAAAAVRRVGSPVALTVAKQPLPLKPLLEVAM